MASKQKEDRINKTQVFDLMKEAGLINSQNEMGEIAHGTLTFGGEIVGFQGELGFYSRKEVIIFIAGYRETHRRCA